MIERFAVPDELTCYYDRPSEPANVHVEVAVPDRLGAAAIRESVRAVLAAEPELRVRRAPGGSWRSGHRWEFPVPPVTDLVGVESYADQAELDRRRDAFLSGSPSLDLAPPLRFLHATGPAGDHLILNAHHAFIDGLSCLRLMREVAARYHGVDTRQAAPQEAGTDHVRSRARPSGGIRPARRADPAGQGDLVARERPEHGRSARIAPGAGRHKAAPGYGTQLLSWDANAVAGSLRQAGASVNDLLIAALMMTISDWNETRSAPY